MTRGVSPIKGAVAGQDGLAKKLGAKGAKATKDAKDAKDGAKANKAAENLISGPRLIYRQD